MKLDGLWKHTNYARLSDLSTISTSTRLLAAIAALALSFAVPVSAGELGNCAAEYTSGQGGLNCTAADDGGEVTATNVPSFCVISEFLTFDVTSTFLNSSQAERYDPRYWVAVDGGDVRRLTSTVEREMRPAWSPDGKRIAFTSVRDGNHEVYVMDSAGNNVLRVTDHPEMDDWPVWHPDGKRLVIVSERDGNHDLYLVEVD